MVLLTFASTLQRRNCPVSVPPILMSPWPRLPIRSAEAAACCHLPPVKRQAITVPYLAFVPEGYSAHVPPTAGTDSLKPTHGSAPTQIIEGCVAYGVVIRAWPFTICVGVWPIRPA